MKVLVLGSGGREHALCWHLRRSAKERGEQREIYCAPGSSAIGSVADIVPIDATAIERLADFATELQIDLTIVGPEQPLALGVVDEFVARGLPIFGPTRDAARLESSKVFAKEFMQRHDIPTAQAKVVESEEELVRVATAMGLPVALKADGLAAGKGVLLVHDEQQLGAAAAQFFSQRRFGDAADRVLVEEFLVGQEVSFIALSDGQRLLPLATSKDYKRIFENDEGPNTGGMGAHSPSGIVSGQVARTVFERVLQPTVEGMRREGTPFVGVLYAGIMLTSQGPRVLEFNTRFGDPEAQALLLRLEDDLGEVLAAGALGDFVRSRLSFRSGASACLVLAAEGYPDVPVTGAAIEGLKEAAATDAQVEVFHAGTRQAEDGGFVVAGGRALNVCATGSSLREALRRAYLAAEKISWPGIQVRPDIGRDVVASGELRNSGMIRVPRDLLKRADE